MPTARHSSGAISQGLIAERYTSRRRCDRVRKKAAEMGKENGEFPLHFAENRMSTICFYGDSEVVEQLKLMPFVADRHRAGVSCSSV